MLGAALKIFDVARELCTFRLLKYVLYKYITLYKDVGNPLSASRVFLELSTAQINFILKLRSWNCLSVCSHAQFSITVYTCVV